MSGVLAATDLDRTVIYSPGALGPAPPPDSGLTCVEVHDGKPAAYMTVASADALRSLAVDATLVPVTTRTVEQLRRVRLPGAHPRYAVAANGAVLLVDGAPDRAWSRRVRARLQESAPLGEVWDFVARICRPEWTIKLRNADDFFCYAVVHRSRMPESAVAELTEWTAARGWTTSTQGRKVYWVPAALTKSAAVTEIRDRIDADLVLAAGDSLLDLDLLEACDRGVHPAHGEIFLSGWTAPHVHRTVADNVWAGEEIAQWLRTTAATYARGLPA